MVVWCGGHRNEVGHTTMSANEVTIVVDRRGETEIASATTSDAEMPSFGDVRTEDDHREVDVTFVSDGAALAGTLFLPLLEGLYPSLVWVHGSGEQARLQYGDLVAAVVDSGVTFFSYDKRGVGESAGECCPADAEDAGDADFGEQADDALAALEALHHYSEVDPDHVGYLGVSQAGWIVPIAAARSSDVAFVVLASAATVTTGEEQFYSELTGDADLSGDEHARLELSRQLAEHGPSGFDPEPYLAEMGVPGLWLFGSDDGSIPTVECEAVLDTLKAAGKDFTYIVFDGAGHGLLDIDPPPPPEVIPTIVDWISQHS